MTITNTSSITAPVNRILQTNFLEDARPQCHYLLGTREGEVIQAHNGSFTMLWRQYNNLTPTTTALTEDTGTLAFPIRNGTEVTVTDQTATVSKYGQHAFITEELTLRDVTRASLEITEIFAVSGGRSLNRLQRNVVEDNATLIYASGASADGGVVDVISAKLIQQAINTLDRNFAMTHTTMSSGSTNVGSLPINEAYLGICHADVAADVSELAGFKGVEQYASHISTMPGEFGMITIAGKAVRFISTGEASADTGSGGAVGAGIRATTGNADLYTTVICGKNAVGAISLDTNLIRETYRAGDRVPGLIMIETPMGSAGAADPMQEMKSIGYKFWHGGTVLNSNWIRGIRTGATDLTV